MAKAIRFSKLFSAGQVGSLRLKNRIIMPAMGTFLTSDTEAVTPKLIDHYVARAKGGVGLIIVEGCAVVDSRLGGLWHLIRLDNDKYIAGHYELVETVHLSGARIVLQLLHPGRLASLEATEGRQPVAPSPIMVQTPELIFPGMVPPREISPDEIGELVEDFASAAARARRAGYDGVECHGAHGYLIHEFLSPVTNKRADNYGGSIENRVRFPIEIVRRIRGKCGKNFPVLFRMTAEDTADGGYTLEDAKVMAKYLEDAGVDALDITMGGIEDKDGISRNVDPTSYPQGWRIPYVAAIKEEVQIPTIAVGVIREPEFAESVLAEGKADFIAIGRGLLADPEWAKKAYEGRPEDIRKCISCNHCGLSFIQKTPIRCTVNAATGREKEFAEITQAAVPKEVMIVGSGPAGMEAARIACLRGHRVSLYEKGKGLGDGQLSLCSKPPHKEKMNWVGEFLATQVQKLNVEVHLESEVTAETVRAVKPDVLIVATGATLLIPEIPGINKKHVVTAHDVLYGKVSIEGKQVAVLGGFSMGCETAEFLAERDNKVMIISRSPARALARGANLSNRVDLIVRISKNENITVLNDHNVKEISDEGIVVMDKRWQERFLKADRVILARGVKPVNDLAEQLKDEIKEVYTIGDAAEPRDIAAAILEGAVIARRI